MSRSLRFRQNHHLVQIITDGRLAVEVPWEKAEEIIRALTSVTRKAEEWAKAQQLIDDGAVLMRTGAPFWLSDHPAILAEAKKKAEWDRTLRRAIPGIPSREAFGIPTITQSTRIKK